MLNCPITETILNLKICYPIKIASRVDINCPTCVSVPKIKIVSK